MANFSNLWQLWQLDVTKEVTNITNERNRRGRRIPRFTRDVIGKQSKMVSIRYPESMFHFEKLLQLSVMQKSSSLKYWGRNENPRLRSECEFCFKEKVWMNWWQHCTDLMSPYFSLEKSNFLIQREENKYMWEQMRYYKCLWGFYISLVESKPNASPVHTRTTVMMMFIMMDNMILNIGSVSNRNMSLSGSSEIRNHNVKWLGGVAVFAKVCFAQCSMSRLALGSPGCSSFVVTMPKISLKTL